MNKDSTASKLSELASRAPKKRKRKRKDAITPAVNLDKYQLEEVRIRLKAAKTPEQQRRVIDSYPDLEGRDVVRVRAICDTNLDMLRGLPAGTTRRRRLSGARKFGWGKKNG